MLGQGSDQIDGGEGFDVLDLSAATGRVTVDFGRGRVSGDGIGTGSFTGVEQARFGAGDDVILGGSGADNIAIGDGRNTVSAGAGDDTVIGGAGQDDLDSGSGDDVVFGGAGYDLLSAGSGRDLVNGGEGNDVIRAGSGQDTIIGGAGDDLLLGGSGDDVFWLAQGSGHDVITDFRRGDVLKFVETVFETAEDLLARAVQEDRDVVLTLSEEDSITLQRVDLGSLTADDFRFA